ncbi:ribonuclease inhibitor [Chitinophaga oryzae]|uniref:Ribonuclease inhibitor n=1 Tax=Chitinophaga oryzae TaxID=2725414 RepID=A0AAE6ZGN4_9BACT|nr:c-type cytochrome domain-containing protein [Chitinophaga oryzae]QJB32443.1 ribonuclease inhibitor [Chitinophaga oryzae]
MKILAATGNWNLFIGRIHPLIVHLPIGILMIAFVLALLARSSKRAGLRAALPLLLLAAALSAVASCVAGYLLSLDGGYDEHLLNTHLWLGIGVAVSSALLWLMSVIPAAKRLARFELPLFALLLVLVSAAGHYGGSLTHGDDYLLQAMPPALQSFAGKKAVADNEAAYTNVGDARVYEDLVAPVLSTRCYGCHNAQKLKGGLRLETIALIREGGEHGPVLKDSMPEESELFKRLVLPDNDEHRMPPKGKPQLSPREVELLYWWIAQGAPTDKTVKELKPNPRIQLVLEAMTPGKALDHNEFVPEGAPSAPDRKSMEALEAKGVKVLPIAANSPFVAVSCVNAADFSDADMKLLHPLRSQLIWLDLSGTRITDAALADIAQLTALTRLELKQTAVKGSAATPLAGCGELRYLNLSGTACTPAFLTALAKNKKLQQLYLYQANPDAHTLQKLRQQLPKLSIDTGGYRLEPLASDTIIYKRKTV